MIDAENLKIKVKTKDHEKQLRTSRYYANVFFERLLYRISISAYKYNFILKGGLLLSAIFGDDRRTTQDMDTMIKGIPLDAKKIEKIINEIINVDCEDGISYSLKKSSKIRLNFKNYKNKKSYVSDIDYDEIMNAINLLIELLKKELVTI